MIGETVELFEYPAETLVHRGFPRTLLDTLDCLFLPEAAACLVDEAPQAQVRFIRDDNRTAISPRPAATLDGLPFYLSVKGVGSTVEPFAHRPLSRDVAAGLTDRDDVRRRLVGLPSSAATTAGVITGELWLRGSPYGGQGLAHAEAALRISERADLTDLHGARIAPVLRVALFPEELQERLRSIHWFRKYPGRFVQELRLVPSNVRLYFHSRSTIGTQIGDVFDQFGVHTPGRALAFERNFVRSGIALLSLFARTLEVAPGTGRVRGLDFQDVWLDKDAVVAPDGTIYFVDLEGIAPVTLERSEVREKIEDQIFRSLYEFMFAYEQVEEERARRFGAAGSRKAYFACLLADALREDPFVRVLDRPNGVILEVRNLLGDQGLNQQFPLVDR